MTEVLNMSFPFATLKMAKESIKQIAGSTTKTGYCEWSNNIEYYYGLQTMNSSLEVHRKMLHII